MAGGKIAPCGEDTAYYGGICGRESKSVFVNLLCHLPQKAFSAV